MSFGLFSVFLSIGIAWSWTSLNEVTFVMGSLLVSLALLSFRARSQTENVCLFSLAGIGVCGTDVLKAQGCSFLVAIIKQ